MCVSAALRPVSPVTKQAEDIPLRSRNGPAACAELKGTPHRGDRKVSTPVAHAAMYGLDVTIDRDASVSVPKVLVWSGLVWSGRSSPRLANDVGVGTGWLASARSFVCVGLHLDCRNGGEEEFKCLLVGG